MVTITFNKLSKKGSSFKLWEIKIPFSSLLDYIHKPALNTIYQSQLSLRYGSVSLVFSPLNFCVMNKASASEFIFVAVDFLHKMV